MKQISGVAVAGISLALLIFVLPVIFVYNNMKEEIYSQLNTENNE